MEKVARACFDSEALAISRSSAASSNECFGMTPIAQSISAVEYRRLYVTRTVSGLTTSSDSTASYDEARGEALRGFSNASYVNLTSSAVNGTPSCQRTPA